MSRMHNVVCIRRRVRAYDRPLEAAKTLITRDHVRRISRPSTLLDKNESYGRRMEG